MRDLLPVSKITFRCRREETARQQLSPLAWRDRIEWQFKKIACITIKRACDVCAVRKGCIVAFLFSPLYWFEGKKDCLSGSLPLPWVPRYPEDISSPEFSLEITLIGRKAIGLFPYWFVALDRLGKTKHPRFTVISAASDTEEGTRLLYDATGETVVADPGRTPPRTFAGARRLRMEIVTPLRLFERKQPILEPAFHHISESAYRRAEALAQWYGESPLPEAGQRRAQNSRVIVSRRLVWQERVAFSRRQKETVSLGGLVGSLELEGELEPFGELLGIGELVGIGKGTALGLGRYRIAAIAK